MPPNAVLEGILSGAWMTLFNVIQRIDPVYDVWEAAPGQMAEAPVWPIMPDEGKQLAAASVGILDTLPKKQRKALAVFLNKNAAPIMLCVALGQIAGPRAMKSLEVKRARTVAQRSGRPRPAGVTDIGEARAANGARASADGVRAAAAGAGPAGDGAGHVTPDRARDLGFDA